ncbi:MAG: hypothetical protein R3D28_21290 [Geminicoccaceae bacterium]
MLATLDGCSADRGRAAASPAAPRPEEPTAAVDLGALVESLVADQADLGADVTVAAAGGRRSCCAAGRSP